jgi:hypothetical protein
MLVFAADTHIAHHAWASMPDVCEDAYHSYNQIIDWCCKHKPQALILGGDIFDHVPSPVDFKVFLIGIDRLRQARIPVCAVQGQHGRYRDLSWTSVLDWVEDLEQIPYYKIGKFVIAGLDNRPPEELKAEIARKCTPDVNILVLHQLCRGTVHERNGQQSWDFDPVWLPDSLQLVLMGDFHQEWETDHVVTESGVVIPIVYSGSTCMQSVSEPVKKSFLVVKDDYSYERIPLQTRHFETICLHGPDHNGANELQSAAKYITSLPKGALVQVRFDPQLPDVERTLKAVDSPIHLMFRPYTADIELNPRTIDAHTTTLEACLSQIIDRDKEADFHSFMLDLLRSKDLNQTLSRWRDAVMRYDPLAPKEPQ